MNDVLFGERSTAEVTTDEKQNRQGSTLSGLLSNFLLKLTTRERVMFSASCPRFISRKTMPDLRKLRQTVRDRNLTTNNEPRTIPKGAHTRIGLVPAWFVVAPNDIITLFLGRL